MGRVSDELIVIVENTMNAYAAWYRESIYDDAAMRDILLDSFDIDRFVEYDPFEALMLYAMEPDGLDDIFRCVYSLRDSAIEDRNDRFNELFSIGYTCAERLDDEEYSRFVGCIVYCNRVLESPFARGGAA